MRSPLLELKRELLVLEQKGRKFLSIDKLMQYCDIAEGEFGDKLRSESADRDYRHKMEVWRVGLESSRQETQLVNESAFQALKTLVLLSGGSSAAVLAFLGAIWDGAAPVVRADLAGGLGYFGSALIVAAFSYGLTYLALLFFFEYESPRTGNALRFIIIFLVITCYLLMGLGLIQCYKAIAF